MSEEEKVEKTQVQILRDTFEGMKGRQLKERALLSWRGVAVFATSLATVGLGSVPIQVAHADQIYVDCKVDKLINAISSAANRDFLSLTPGCIYTLTAVNNSDPNLGDNGLPVINVTLTIKGNGATIRRQSTPAVPKFRIFQVAPGGDLTISDLTVDNGDTSGSDPKAGKGGGIFNLGALKVTNSTLSRNHANFGGGGIGNGIPADVGLPVPGNLTLSDSVFFDNDGGFVGGAIANGATSTMNLTGCTISHNTTSIDGGGIANQGTAILNKCTISGNIVTGSVQGPNGLLGGGAIVNAGQLFLTDSSISGNSVTYTGSGNQNGFGGGLLNLAGATATLTRSNVIDNSATNGGGGILNGALQGAFGTVTLTSSDVTGNSATSDGGGIINGGQMALTHTNVTGNNAAGNGGGIANLSLPGVTTPATLTLVHTDVTNNAAGQGHLGGGVFNQAANTVSLNQSIVAFNKLDDCNPSCPSMTSAMSTSR
jgi:hypothetical protein